MQTNLTAKGYSRATMPKPARNSTLTDLIDRVEMVREEMLTIQRELERRESDKGQDRGKAQPRK